MTLAHDHAPQYLVWLQKVVWFRRCLNKAPTYGQTDRWLDEQIDRCGDSGTSPHPLNIVTGGGLKPQPYQTQVDILTQPYLSISSWWTRLVPAHLNVDKDAMIGFIQRLACFGLQRHLKGNFGLPWRQAARLGDVQWVLKQLDGLPPDTGYNMILATQDTWYWLQHLVIYDWQCFFFICNTKLFILLSIFFCQLERSLHSPKLY